MDILPVGIVGMGPWLRQLHLPEACPDFMSRRREKGHMAG